MGSVQIPPPQLPLQHSHPNSQATSAAEHSPTGPTQTPPSVLQLSLLHVALEAQLAPSADPVNGGTHSPTSQLSEQHSSSAVQTSESAKHEPPSTSGGGLELESLQPTLAIKLTRLSATRH